MSEVKIDDKAEIKVNIEELLDAEGARWEQVIKVERTVYGDNHYLNGRLPIDEARSLWSDLGKALHTVDAEL